MPPYFGGGDRLGLLALEPVSIAPDSIADRVLYYHRELRLEEDELRALLDLQGDYRRHQLEGRIRFAIAGHMVRPTAQPPVPATESAAHLKTRASLFFQEESRVSTYTGRVREVLGEARWNLLVDLYREETQRDLVRLGPAIAAAVGPAFTLHSAGNGRQVDPNAQFPPAPSSVEPDGPVGSGHGVDRAGYGPWGTTDWRAGWTEPAHDRVPDQIPSL